MAKGNGEANLVNENMLMEAVEAILVGMENMQKDQKEERRKEVQELKEEIQGVSEQVENLDEKIDANYKNTSGKIKAMKATSVSRAEFEDLRDEVQRLKKSFASS